MYNYIVMINMSMHTYLTVIPSVTFLAVAHV